MEPTPTQQPAGRWRLRDYLPFAIFITVVLCMIGRGFRNSFDVAWNEERTQGVITGRASHGSYYYRYNVNGREYSGVGMPESDPDSPTPPAVGSEVEVRYSGERPWKSGLSDPLLFPKQVACMVAIVTGFALIIWLTRRPRSAAERGAPRDPARR